MDELASFERELGDWMASDFNPACGCCERRRRTEGHQLLLRWTLKTQDDQETWLDEHGADRYVGALEELVWLAQEDGYDAVHAADEIEARWPRPTP